MSTTNTATMDPLIEGYLSYLDKVGRKTFIPDYLDTTYVLNVGCL